MNKRSLIVFGLFAIIVLSLVAPLIRFNTVKAVSLFVSGWEDSGGSDVTDDGAWVSAGTGSGSTMTVQSAFAPDGTYNLRMTDDAYAGYAYLTKDLGVHYSKLFVQSTWNFSTLVASGENQIFTVFRDMEDSTDRIAVSLRNIGGTCYISVGDANVGYYNSTTTISANTNYVIEVCVSYAASVGYLTLWIDENLEFNATSINYNEKCKSIYFGMYGRPSTPVALTYEADKVEVADSYIGTAAGDAENPEVVRISTLNKLVGNDTIIGFEWSDDIEGDYLIPCTNITGSLVNGTAIALAGSSGFETVEATWNVNEDDVVQVTGYMNDTSDNWDSTTVYFTITDGNHFYLDFEDTDDYDFCYLGQAGELFQHYSAYTTRRGGFSNAWDRGGYGFYVSTNGVMLYEPTTTHVGGSYAAQMNCTDPSDSGSSYRMELLRDLTGEDKTSDTIEYVRTSGWFMFPDTVEYGSYLAFDRLVYERMWNSTATMGYQEFQVSLSINFDGRGASYGQQILTLNLGKGDVDNNNDGVADSYSYRNYDLYSNYGSSNTVPDSFLTQSSFTIENDAWYNITSIVYRNFDNFDSGYIQVYVNGTLIWDVQTVRTIGMTPSIIDGMNHSEYVDNEDVAYSSTGVGCYTSNDADPKAVYVDDLYIDFTLEGDAPTFFYVTQSSPVGEGTVIPSIGVHQYIANYNVSLIATAAEDYEFAAWSVDGVNETTTESTWYVYANDNHTVQAYFSYIGTESAMVVTITLPADITNLIAYLADGDLIGFLVSCYTSVIGQFFYVILILCFTVPLALRTQSITYVAIVWLLCGSVMIPAVPLISPASVLLLILGIGGLIYRVYANE